jgi:hypothetical protein
MRMQSAVSVAVTILGSKDTEKMCECAYMPSGSFSRPSQLKVNL